MHSQILEAKKHEVSSEERRSGVEGVRGREVGDEVSH